MMHQQGRSLTNRAAMSISMLVDKPQTAVPRAAKKTAIWFAPLRPMTLHKRPYNGVNVHVARRYLRQFNEITAHYIVEECLRSPKPARLLRLVKFWRNTGEHLRFVWAIITEEVIISSQVVTRVAGMNGLNLIVFGEMIWTYNLETSESR